MASPSAAAPVAAAIESSLSAVDAEQRAMMEERVIVTDYYDNPICSGSKKESASPLLRTGFRRGSACTRAPTAPSLTRARCPPRPASAHIWRNIQHGMVHRAFSVFLFTPEGKLVLQQRAATKVTFARIWANTCCSHPLDVSGERAMEGAAGVKNAARRKLEQELGIAPADVPLESFTWLTRVHYAGASADAQPQPGGEPLWGEHEIDWILVCAPPVAPRITPNPNEVQAVREFSQDELRAWLREGGGGGGGAGGGAGAAADALVTPWFGVMERSGLLYRWWDAVLGKAGLDGVLERDVIHRQPDLEALAAGAAKGSVAEPPALAACRGATHAAGTMGPKVACL